MEHLTVCYLGQFFSDFLRHTLPNDENFKLPAASRLNDSNVENKSFYTVI